MEGTRRYARLDFPGGNPIHPFLFWILEEMRKIPEAIFSKNYHMHITKNAINEMEQRYRAAFINSLGGFKSLILVGTADSKGATNLSVLNSLFHIGANPPLCGMIFRPDVAERHTLDNILETGWYTINHVTESIFKAAHQTSARYPKEVSEFDAVGLTQRVGFRT